VNAWTDRVLHAAIAPLIVNDVVATAMRRIAAFSQVA
jgi:hypothetical protein